LQNVDGPVPERWAAAWRKPCQHLDVAWIDSIIFLHDRLAHRLNGGAEGDRAAANSCRPTAPAEVSRFAATASISPAACWRKRQSPPSARIFIRCTGNASSEFCYAGRHGGWRRG
jgi:hypothetical protein